MDDASYQKALDVIQRARQDPAADKEKLRSLVGMVREYQQGQTTKANAPRVPESRSAFAPELQGPQGMDMLQQKLGSPEANEQRGNAEATGIPTLRREQRLQGAPDAMADTAANEAHAADVMKQYQDRTLPSASGIKALYRPPETKPVDPGKAGAINALTSIFTADHYQEPTVEQFHRDMGPAIGPRTLALNENSPEYQQYADQQWAKVYDQAQAQGKSAVRHRYAPTEGAAQTVAHAMLTGADAVEGATAGVASGVSFGAIPALAGKLGGDQTALDVQSAGERSPVANALGRYAGAIANPLLRGVGALGKMATGMLPEAATAGAPVATSALASGLGGAAAGGTAALGEDAVSAATGDEPFDAKATGSRMANGIQTGMLAGVGADLLGSGASALTKQLRTSSKLAPFVNLAEQAGARLGLTGVKPGKAISAAREAAQPGDPATALAEDMVGPLTGEARTRVASQAAETEATNQAYYRKHAQDTRSSGPLLDWVLDARGALAGPDGEVLPGREAAARTLDGFTSKLVKVQATLPGDDTVVARGGNARAPGTRAYSLTDATAKGIDQNQIMAAAKEAGFPEEMADQLHYVVIPQKVNPQQVDALHDGVNLIMKEGKGGEPDPALAGMGRAVRQVRDQFPDDPILGGAKATITDPATGKQTELKGWSAFKHEASQQASETNQTLGLAGVNGAIPETPDANQFKAARGAIADYGNPKRAAENEALKDLAGDARQGENLRTLGGMRGIDELNRRGNILGGGLGEYRHRIVNRGRLSLDPVFQTLGKNPDANDLTPFAGLQLKGGAVGRGLAEASNAPALGFVGPDGNGRAASDEEANQVQQGAALQAQLGVQPLPGRANMNLMDILRHLRGQL